MNSLDRLALDRLTAAVEALTSKLDDLPDKLFDAVAQGVRAGNETSNRPTIPSREP
jgi:outer membrane murein-binding lipoprotein Lpp